MIWMVMTVATAMILSKVNLCASCHWRLLRWIPVPGMPSPCSSGHKRDALNICLNHIYQPQVMWQQTPISLPYFGWNHTTCIWELFPARHNVSVSVLATEVYGSLFGDYDLHSMLWVPCSLCHPLNCPFTSVCWPLPTLAYAGEVMLSLDEYPSASSTYQGWCCARDLPSA